MRHCASGALLVFPAELYGDTDTLLTEDMFVRPRTKHIASRMFDFPEPLRPVIALNEGSQPVIVVLTG